MSGLPSPLQKLLDRLWVPQPGPWRPDMTRKEQGRWGELVVALHYVKRRRGAVLARNWRGGGGELDLVLREGDTLVIVEVKTRPEADADPLATVRDPVRRRHLVSAGRAYHMQLPRPRPAMRFDIALVIPDESAPKKPRIVIHEDVISGGG